MKNPKLLGFLLFFSMAFYNCVTDDSDNPDENSGDDPATILSNNRTQSIQILTADNKKVWKITSAELVNVNGTYDISENFNVQDDEFIFKTSSLVTSKNTTDLNGTLEWRKNSDIEQMADSQNAALNEFYVPSEEYSIAFEEGSSSKILVNDKNFEFTVAENGTASGVLVLENATLNIGLNEKSENDYKKIPPGTVNFTSAFTFESNGIAGFAPDMVGSLANNSIYISTREDGRQGPTGLRPERIVKYDLTSNLSTEKLYFQSDFVSKQLIINNNKLLVVGAQKINSYDLDIIADPTSSQKYADELGLQSFFVSRNGTAVNNNSVYIIGGSLGDETLADRIYKYDIISETMTEFAVMPETRSGARAEIVNNKLYVFGGSKKFFTPPAENEIYIYDLNTAALTIETMPTAVDFTYAGRSGNLIYVAGNKFTWDTTTSSSDEEPYLAVYDTDNGTYTELQTDLMSPGKESIHAMAVFLNKIYIIYGKRETVDQGTFQTWQVMSASI